MAKEQGRFQVNRQAIAQAEREDRADRIKAFICVVLTVGVVVGIYVWQLSEVEVGPQRPDAPYRADLAENGNDARPDYADAASPHIRKTGVMAIPLSRADYEDRLTRLEGVDPSAPSFSGEYDGTEKLPAPEKTPPTETIEE